MQRFELPEPWATPELFSAMREIVNAIRGTDFLPERDVPLLRALTFCEPSAVRVVILGQDPYPQRGKANGLCFGIHDAYRREYTAHSSFANFLWAIRRAGFGAVQPEQWGLEHLARQGVLMLNTRLSVAPGQPMSHADIGWDAVIKAIVAQLGHQHIVWLAFGAEARRDAQRLAERDHEQPVFAYSHPCKYSADRGSHLAPAFNKSDPFGDANRQLVAWDLQPIQWGDAADERRGESGGRKAKA